MKKYLLVLLGISFIFGFNTNSFADVRRYVWTYEYITMPKGMWEIEYYLTNELPNINRRNVNTWKHWLELEYGITDNWDVSIYQMWKYLNKAKEGDSQYDGFKLRTRYKIGKKGQFLVDPLLYLEYIRDDDFHKANVGEAKLILAKDIGKLNFSYNQVLKVNLESDGLAQREYAAGISYALANRLRCGLEAKGSYTKDKSAFGPTFSFSARKFWVSCGAVFGLNDRTDDLNTRLIFGIPF